MPGEPVTHFESLTKAVLEVMRGAMDNHSVNWYLRGQPTFCLKLTLFNRTACITAFLEYEARFTQDMTPYDILSRYCPQIRVLFVFTRDMRSCETALK